jgi:hypothetical protein
MSIVTILWFKLSALHNYIKPSLKEHISCMSTFRNFVLFAVYVNK